MISPACKKMFNYFLKMGRIYFFKFFPLLYSILSLPISSFKFLLRLITITGSFWKIHLKDLFTDKMFCLRVTLLIFSRYPLNVKRNFCSFSGGIVFLLKVLPSLFFLLIIYVYLLVRFVILIDKSLFELFTILTDVIWCSTDPFGSKQLIIRNTIF